MPEIPVTINGVTRLVWVRPLSEKTWAAAEHQHRRLGVLQRRMYEAGEQYGRLNATTAAELANVSIEALDRLPEHQRRHEYSEHIGEGMSFLADQVVGGMIMESEAPQVAEQLRVNTFIESLWDGSSLKYREQEIVKEVLVAGDLLGHLVTVEPKEEDDPRVRIDLYEAEVFEIDYDPRDWRRMVEVRIEETEEYFEGDTSHEVEVVRIFTLDPLRIDDFVLFNRIRPTDEQVGVQLVERVYRGADREEPDQVIEHPFDFFPFVHIHGEYQEIRSMWGKSFVTLQMMNTVDRYNATLQQQYLAIRYNSTAQLATVGDAAMNILNSNAVETDIADVLALPGGTGVHSIELPTQVDLYESQLEKLIDALFAMMGLQRIDNESLSGFGTVSGYALEILNRKSDGTFRRTVQNLRQGIDDLLQMAFLVDSYARAAEVVVVGEGDEAFSILVWWDVPEAWPNTQVRVDFGTAYIVDEIAVRDDFNSGLISRREALRQRGYSEKQIEKIIAEIAEEDTVAETPTDAIRTGAALLDLE